MSDVYKSAEKKMKEMLAKKGYVECDGYLVFEKTYGVRHEVLDIGKGRAYSYMYNITTARQDAYPGTCALLRSCKELLHRGGV